MIRRSGILALMPLWVTALLLVLSAAACSRPGDDWSQYHNVPAEGWRYGDTLRFTPDMPDSVVTGHLVVAVSHTLDYPLSSLWLEVCTAGPSGNVRRDTVAFPLADEFGRWKGSGLASQLQMADTVARPVTLVAGKPVKVRHIMRADTLPGISKVGVFFLPD